jgi:hypothetical protein
LIFVIVFEFVRSEVLTAAVMKNSILWDITPYSPFKVNRRFGRTSPPYSGWKNKQAELFQPPVFTLVSFSAYSSTMKMDAICFSETSVDF